MFCKQNTWVVKRAAENCFLWSWEIFIFVNSPLGCDIRLRISTPHLCPKAEHIWVCAHSKAIYRDLAKSPSKCCFLLVVLQLRNGASSSGSHAGFFCYFFLLEMWKLAFLISQALGRRQNSLLMYRCLFSYLHTQDFLFGGGEKFLWLH